MHRHNGPASSDGFERAKYGAIIALFSGVFGAVVVFLFAPPLPIGPWAVYARALVSLVAFGFLAAIVWFLTVVTIMGDM